jgi:DNA-binding MarR family transcriptional regulator
MIFTLPRITLRTMPMTEQGAPGPACVTEKDALDLGPLPGLIGYTLRRAQLAVFADFQDNFAELDLRPTQLSVLLVLRHNPGARPSAVADTLAIKRTNFAPLLNGLMERRLVERRSDERDRRAQTLHLTEAGTALLDRAAATLDRHETGLQRRLGPDGYAALLALLERLL